MNAYDVKEDPYSFPVSPKITGCCAYVYLKILVFSLVIYFFKWAIQLRKEGWVQNKTTPFYKR